MTAGWENGAGTANGTESDSWELGCIPGWGGKLLPISRRLTSVPFARHLRHVPAAAFAPVPACRAPRVGWELPGRRTALVSDPPALPCGSPALPAAEQPRERGQLPAQPPRPGVPAPKSPATLARAPSRCWEPKGPCASWEKKCSLDFSRPRRGSVPPPARSRCGQAPCSHGCLPCPGSAAAALRSPRDPRDGERC